MTRRDQKAFVRALATRLEKKVLDAIARQDVPSSWDGVELRQYFTDLAKESIFTNLLTGKRKRDYDNTVTINNL